MTEFDEKVWNHVRAIPPGKVSTYGGVAKAVGSQPRPVGQALKRCPPDVPWWRVTNAGGVIGDVTRFQIAQIVMLELEGVPLTIRVSKTRMMR